MARGTNGNGTRVAVVAGLRTPFAKQSSAYKNMSALELGQAVVNELLVRTGVSPSEIEQVVYGQVLPSIAAPNIAREIVLGTGMPRNIEAFSVSRACATSYQSTVSIAEAILTGAIDCGLSGGADSSTDVPITVSKKLSAALLDASKAKTLGERLKAFSKLSPKDLVPVPPAIVEYSTGLSMGESAEKMAKENHISRAAQDELAHQSHTKAANAWKQGWLADEVMTVYVQNGKGLEPYAKDNLVRDESKLESYTKLKPAFDRKYGTITAGNASPLTDGASALLLMREDKAKALGLTPLGYIKSYAFAALDPRGQMLMGPSYATPIALDRAGVKLKDLDVIDMHEAFAAQVLSNTQAFASKKFAEEKLGRSEAIGEIDPAKFNPTGGSIAIGHPFAATGARQITQTLRELKRRGGNLGLVTACAAGGIGAAMILEVN
ncbi:acetyl-CoA C-acyltransferase FadI [Sandaracinus amylolyticus]|uniref:acetyl-CoA C-acyltransferase FadI n=1 Tax=Sandaracinus amylolyticus TaxID=927083 RepID=UPI00069F6954|nr:acetyl-CoA C-acyltransferase FadI [Sandaracinus amylolyticus]